LFLCEKFENNNFLRSIFGFWRVEKCNILLPKQQLLLFFSQNLLFLKMKTTTFLRSIFEKVAIFGLKRPFLGCFWTFLALFCNILVVLLKKV
jgi:hypothetical protein